MSDDDIDKPKPVETESKPAPAQMSVPPPVSPQTISRAPVEVPTSDAQSQRERDALAHEAAQFERELGWIGKLFGGRHEKAGNIAAIALFLCFFAIAGLWIIYIIIQVHFAGTKVAAPAIPVERASAALGGLIALILGYLFGSKSDSS